MKYKHLIKNKIRVFVSSSMKDKKNLELRKGVKSYFDRTELYDCFILESFANPDNVDEVCLKEVRKSVV